MAGTDSNITGNSMASTDALGAKQSQLQAERASLKIQLANLQALPAFDASGLYRGALGEENDKLARELASMEEKAVVYRSAGWTCFEIDLDVGRRARESRRELQSGTEDLERGKDSDLGLGVRLDTFFRGRYYEPYYLVFARSSQMLDTPKLVGTVLGDANDADGAAGDGLTLVRHTVPHFVPLVNLLERYIPTVLDGSASGGGSSSKQRGDGGLSLLSDFQELPGVEAFLSALHCHLQAFVSRREQAVSLGQAQLPGMGEHERIPASTMLHVSGSDAFDLLKVVWQIPREAPAGSERDTDVSAAPSPDVDQATSEPAAKRRREDERAVKTEVELPSTSLEVLIHYTDRRADRLIDPTLKVEDRTSQHGDATGDDVGEDAAPEPFVGTEKPYGRVRIELIVAPSLASRVKKTTTAATTSSRGGAADPDALEPERTWRKDLEKLFAQEVEGEGLELDEALEVVAERVWQQQQQEGGATAARSFFRIPRDRLPAKTTPPLLKPQTGSTHQCWGLSRSGARLNPDPYNKSPPDFAALADLYPDSLGKHVRHIGQHGSSTISSGTVGRGYATLDFQDAEAVRCLAETLLYHDFGLEVKLHENRLCPMIPNRLNYILYLRKVLDSSLTCLRHIEAARAEKSSKSGKRSRSPRGTDWSGERVRGLDIGTGASAIYPLLGCAIEPNWKFIATDIDAESLVYARQTIESASNNRFVTIPSSTTTGRSSFGPITINHRLRDRVHLLQRREEEALIPSEAYVHSDDQETQRRPRFHFTMCNPPFYTSEEDMQESARFKENKPNAICHGTASEMITMGGEVSFVRRMVQESRLPENRDRVLWYSSMLGKLSSVSAVVDGIKAAGIESWAVTKLVQGQTRRWVVSWTFTGLRLPETLCRHRDTKLDPYLSPNTRRSTTISIDLFASPLSLLTHLQSVLANLDDCQTISDENSYTVSALLSRQSWTRSARRAKTRNGSTNEADAVHMAKEPELCVDFRVESQQDAERDEVWKVEADWRWGRESKVFESFIAHVFKKVRVTVAERVQ